MIFVTDLLKYLHWSAPGTDPVPQLSTLRSHRERAGLSGVLAHLKAQVRPPLLLKFLAQEWPAQSHQDMGTKERPGIRSFQFATAPQSWPCATALHTQILPRENWSPRSADTQTFRRHKPKSETARPANTRDNQEQEHKQQKPMLLGIIRTQFFHHSESWTPQHIRKARFWFKITSHDEDRGL